MVRWNKYYIFIGLSLLYFICVFFTRNHIFFWDTVQLGSKHAHWFYENNLKPGFLPETMDSGHIPFFGYYLAVCWEFFGKTLPVSHFAMLPFGLGIIWQIIRLGTLTLKKESLLAGTFILLADPVLTTQMLLISPDIWLVFFFLLAVNAILKQEKIFLSIGITGLVLTSQRGMMMAFLLLITQAVYQYINKKQAFNLKTIPALIKPYLPGIIIAIGFLILHYFRKGWIGYHEESPWAGSFDIVSFKEFLRNQVILAWRLVDFGKILIWIFIFIHLKHIANLLRKKEQKALFIVLFVSLFMVLYSPVLTIHKNLVGHRYLLPATILLILLAVKINDKYAFKKRSYIHLFLFVGLITGNLWRYPETISVGWDATLAHMPYYGLRKKMISYIEKENIPIYEIGSAFPNTTELRYLNLSEDTTSFSKIDMTTNKYILQSNIFNEINDSTLLTLHGSWILQHKLHHGGVYLRLFKNPKYE
ncbi:MAG: hypothetical protein ACOC0C_04200 [Bacteroidota bacterium]